jgi:hypothetical protein
LTPPQHFPQNGKYGAGASLRFAEDTEKKEKNWIPAFAGMTKVKTVSIRVVIISVYAIILSSMSS